MIKKEDIKLVLDTVRVDWQNVDEKDIAFVILCDAIEDKSLAYRLAYKKNEKDPASFMSTPRFKRLIAALEPFGIGSVNSNTITKEENKGELLKLLESIDRMLSNKELEPKDAIKMQTDIRVKLNDKFEMEESQAQKRIIVVPSKHDIVCPQTNRECNFWPTKRACIAHYGLADQEAATKAKVKENKNE